MGSNMAEAHPVGFQWVMEAKARGARVIHIDPRFTRTSAQADQYVSLRAGTDIAFLGGVINYILGHGLEFREYVQSYTNAPFLLSERYQDTEDLDGLFSGYDPVTASYDPSSWAYDSIAAGTTAPTGTSRLPRTCCAGSAAWTWALAVRSAGTWTCGRTAAPCAVAGSTAACTRTR
jgi:anaerobic selenocysteine-containing dehydrogenase